MKDYGQIKWSISRGKDTEGYRICTLTVNGKKYRCIGGGYDMVGVSMAHYIVDRYRDRLVRHYAENKATNNNVYCLYENGGLNGASGFENVRGIAAAIGISINFVSVETRNSREVVAYEFIDFHGNKNDTATV